VDKHAVYPKMEKYIRTDKYEHKIQSWNITPDVEENEFKPLVDKIISSDQSWYINGPPGAGIFF
jgi:hypothetical protein